MNYKVGCVGKGWVGKAMIQLFPEAVVYDKGLNIGTKEEVNECDIAFICVPTPNLIYDEEFRNKNGMVPSGEGKLDTSIVEEVISWCECPLLVVRSTVNPGDCDRWSKRYHKEIVMQPEYLGETVSHPMFDMKERPFLILGGEEAGRRKLIELYQTVYNANINIHQVTALEAEITKLSENRAIAFKVAQCQELYDVCSLAGADYYKIRELVYSADPRFNLWHTFVFPDARGMNSKCIPKDVYAWCAWAESLGYEPKITRALLEKNKEWLG